jgi:membrane-bound inhibitor of C-type lysozyme
MIPARLALLAALVLPQLAQAETTLQTLRYLCARGVEVPAAYINADDASFAVITVEGRQIALYNQPAASGARYGWPSDGLSYVWWTKGDAATLYWKDETGAETPILTDCLQQN